MSQNEKIVALPTVDFEKHCETLALQILNKGITYDWTMVLLNGAHDVWSYLREVIPYKRHYDVEVSRYRDRETTSRHAPEFSDFPRTLVGHGLIIDDCTDDADTMYESVMRSLQAGAREVSSAVVLYKPDNVKIKDPDTGLKWRPTFIGWDSAPGDIFFDFPREAFKKRVMAAFEAQQSAVTTESSL